MSQFSTGVNSMQALRAMIAVAGDNIANVNSPGFHARRAEVTTRPGPTVGGVRVGEGSGVQSITRLRDALAERMLLADVQVLERVKQEATILDHVELSFQEPSEDSLDAHLGQFFERISGLTANPDDTVLRSQMVQAADSLSCAFNQLSSKVRTMEHEARTDLDLTVEKTNELLSRAARLNQNIAGVESGDVSAPGLKDQRDQVVRQLAELINVKTYRSEHGVLNVTMAGSLLVDGEQHVPLKARETEQGYLLSPQGQKGRALEVREGKLAGLLEGLNSFLPSFRGRLDELASTLRREFNRIHTTGLAKDGRFENLRGVNAFHGDNAFCEAGYGVTEGTDQSIVINIEEKGSGHIDQHELSLDTTVASDTFVQDLADKVNAQVPQLTASVQEGRLSLEADDGFAFGFATPYDPNPAEPGDITAASPTSPQIIDAYKGEEDLDYEFTFLDSGKVGSDQIEVQIDASREDGTQVSSFTRTIPADYQPGKAIALERGMEFTLSEGSVNSGDGFSFTAHAEMDTAGVLDALGVNTFFNGTNAASLEVVNRVKDQPARIAGALRDVSGDNHRLLEMKALRSRKIMDGGNASLVEGYRGLLSNIGAAHSTRAEHQRSLEGAVTELENKVSAASGVSVDEEMMQLLESQRIYQASVKYIKSVDSTLSALLQLV